MDYRTSVFFLVTDAITFVFSDLKRTENGRREKLCQTS